jgi:hypothetical protein
VPTASHPARHRRQSRQRHSTVLDERARPRRQPTQQHCRMTPTSQFTTPDLKSTQPLHRPITVCKQHPVTRSTRYLSQQPAQPPSSQQPPPTNPNKPIARSQPSPCPCTFYVTRKQHPTSPHARPCFPRRCVTTNPHPWPVNKHGLPGLRK